MAKAKYFSSKVTSDQREIRNLLNRLGKLEEYEAEYGYYADQGSADSKLPLSDLALVHNFGSEKHSIPPRPFMEQTNDFVTMQLEITTRWVDDLYKYLKNGGQVTKLYKSFAKEGADSIQRVINRQDFLPNTPDWEAHKLKVYGHQHILIETGLLYESADYKVVRKDVQT